MNNRDSIRFDFQVLRAMKLVPLKTSVNFAISDSLVSGLPSELRSKDRMFTKRTWIRSISCMVSLPRRAVQSCLRTVNSTWYSFLFWYCRVPADRVPMVVPWCGCTWKAFWLSSLVNFTEEIFEGFRRDDFARGSTIGLKAFWRLAYIYCCKKALWKFACCHGVNLVIGVQIYCFDFIIVARIFVISFHRVNWFWLPRHANVSEMIRFVALLPFYTICWAFSSPMVSSSTGIAIVANAKLQVIHG